jgi:hypothetical protein
VTTYSKPSVRSSWGQTASSSDLQDPGNTYASAGWQIGVKPPRQYFNWVLNYVFQGVRYACQNGIATWDPAETYPAGGLAISPNGWIYRSLINNNTNQNPDSTLFTSWDIPYVNSAPSNDNGARIANTGWVRSNFLPTASPFNGLSGQILLSQVPVGAVTQWQGSLSIGGGQVTSAVAAANSFKLSNGNYVTPQWVGQPGQPTWLFGSTDGASIFVWNPANFSVQNANTVAGLGVTSAAAGNTVMARDGNGYAYAVYLNQASSNNENPSISQFMVTNGADGFLRKSSVAAVKAALGALTSANFAFSSGGYQKIADQAIIQGGRATVSGLTAIFFPIAFPHGCFAVVITNEGSTNQIFLNSAPGATFFQATNGNAVIDWIAFGW